MVEDINSLIFRALQVSNLSKVPFLFMGNPGTGKTTSVEWYCNIMGYQMILLRGSQSSPEEILGYDVNEGREDHTATRLIPKWFAELKRHHDEGKKILLFLDEITTASEYVQGALLHLIFERRVGDEKLPDDTLVVAAGNYASNLSSNFNLIPPLMNRFCIFNITPSEVDLRSFMSKYQPGADSKFDKLKELSKPNPDRLNAQLDEGQTQSIKAIIENSIFEFVDQLSKTKELDLSVTELKDIYQDVENSELPGFVSYRSLNYYRECCISMYLQYGLEGMRSHCFKLITLGLVGVGMSLSKKNSGDEVQKKSLYDRFQTNVTQAVTDFEKKLRSNNNRFKKPLMEVLGKYVDESGQLVGAEPTSDDLVKLENVMRAMNSDKSKNNQLEDSLIESITNLLLVAVRKSNDINTITPENINQRIINFNNIVSTLRLIEEPIKKTPDSYENKLKDAVKKCHLTLSKQTFKIKSIIQDLMKNNPDRIWGDLQEVKGIESREKFLED